MTARALAPLAVLAEYARAAAARRRGARGWKGARDEDEESAGAAAAATLGLEPLKSSRARPFEGARDRHLHVFRKRRPTPERFPRRPGMAGKRPLA